MYVLKPSLHFLICLMFIFGLPCIVGFLPLQEILHMQGCMTAQRPAHSLFLRFMCVFLLLFTKPLPLRLVTTVQLLYRFFSLLCIPNGATSTAKCTPLSG